MKTCMQNAEPVFLMVAPYGHLCCFTQEHTCHPPTIFRLTSGPSDLVLESISPDVTLNYEVYDLRTFFSIFVAFSCRICGAFSHFPYQ